MNENNRSTNMKIHSLFIFRKSGTCIYSRNFSNRLKGIDVDLTSGFLSAVCSFSKELISKRLEILETDDLKLVFKSSQDLDLRMDEDFIFVVASDIDVNNLFLQNILLKVMDGFFDVYKELGESREVLTINNPELDSNFDLFVLGNWEKDPHPEYYEEIEILLQDQ
jgi:hypothetical protein